MTGFIFSQFQLRSVSKKTSRAGSRVKRVKDTAAQAKVLLKQINKASASILILYNLK